jgi:phosphatidate cytidylyltransferase
MIGTRLLFGTLLAAVVTGILLGDQFLAPWFPGLFFCLMFVGVFATLELVRLFPPIFRPPEALVVAGVLVTAAANWYPQVQRAMPHLLPAVASPWEPVLFAFAGVFVAALLIEMYRFREPGTVVPRLGLTVFAVAYLGVLSGFIAQLRWLDPDPKTTSLYLIATIFAVKWGDIGAFFAGTFLGRHKMTPVLSPKKTWEGFAGGMVGSALVAMLVVAVGDATTDPAFRGGMLEAAVFGVAVGVAGVLGDLAESLIKRDCQTKDAAKSIPGFGGLLDVIDSVLFAAPVAYFWFRH